MYFLLHCFYTFIKSGRPSGRLTSDYHNHVRLSNLAPRRRGPSGSQVWFSQVSTGKNPALVRIIFGLVVFKQHSSVLPRAKDFLFFPVRWDMTYLKPLSETVLHLFARSTISAPLRTAPENGFPTPGNRPALENIIRNHANSRQSFKQPPNIGVIIYTPSSTV